MPWVEHTKQLILGATVGRELSLTAWCWNARHRLRRKGELFARSFFMKNQCHLYWTISGSRRVRVVVRGRFPNATFLAHLAMPKMSLYDHHLSLSSLLASVSVDSSPSFKNGCFWYNGLHLEAITIYISNCSDLL